MQWSEFPQGSGGGNRICRGRDDGAIKSEFVVVEDIRVGPKAVEARRHGVLPCAGGASDGADGGAGDFPAAGEHDRSAGLVTI